MGAHLSPDADVPDGTAPVPPEEGQPLVTVDAGAAGAQPAGPPEQPVGPPERAGLATFWELSTDLLCIAAPDGTFLHVNPAWTRALGWSQHQLVHTNARDLLHPDDVGPTTEILERLATAGFHVEDFENRYRSLSGEYRVLRWNARTGMDGRVYCVTRDVTDLLADERRLKESEERFRLSMTQAAIGMAIVGLDGSFVDVNDALCRIVGRPREVLTTLTFQDITHPEDLDADLELVGRLAAGEIARYDLEKRYYHADGSIVWVLLSGAALRDEAGAPRYYLAQVQDVTARKAAERELVLTMDDLQRSNEALTDFASIAAHDLKSPLATAISGLDLLSMRFSGDLSAQGQEVLERVEDQLRRLSHQVDGLLRIAAMSGMPLDVEEIAVADSLDRVVEGLGAAVEGLDMAVGPCPPLRADPGALRVLLQNLLENAARHGASRLRVHGEAAADGMVRVLVDDNGPGIPVPDRGRVFELFQQRPGSAGSGLGLATCRRIVERHGGGIGVEDAPDGGTRIWLTLPAA